jgi:hypothetical protein
MRLSYFVLSSLLLVACSKKETPPAPTNELLGQWHAESSSLLYFDSNGKFLRKSTVTYTVEPGTYLEYTEKEAISYLGSVIQSRTSYTRQDTVLHIGTSTAPINYRTIRKLTSHELVLLSGKENLSTGEQTRNSTTYSH